MTQQNDDQKHLSTSERILYAAIQRLEERLTRRLVELERAVKQRPQKTADRPDPDRPRDVRISSSYAELGKGLPRDVLAELMEAPPMMSLAEAARYLGLSESRVRALIHSRQLVGATGSKKGASRVVVPRSAVISYWERRYASRDPGR